MGYEKSFIEVQFPVSKISKESYKERKAGSRQTLTGLGKWWGRKPLILVRAALIGALMPVSDNVRKDMEIFQKILCIDDVGLKIRKNKPILIKDIFNLCNESDKERYFQKQGEVYIPKYKSEVTLKEKEELQIIIFDKLSYDDKLKYCLRIEELENEYKSRWNEINRHLGTTAKDLESLVNELGILRFGAKPKVGDCFCGGGSIPFEAGRIGCDVYASDLNPLAALLTWSSLNIIGGKKNITQDSNRLEEKLLKRLKSRLDEIKINVNEEGWRADAYLYCYEVKCPECGFKVPTAPSWIIGKKTNTVAILNENKNNGYDIKIVSNASKEEINLSEKLITIRKNKLYCPHCENSTPINEIRNQNRFSNEKYGLKLWDEDKFIPDEQDIFQERLYCIRYIKNGEKIYIQPTQSDLDREELVKKIVSENIKEWKDKGYIPTKEIQEGYNTNQLIRERGWKYWYQLYNPRQLLTYAIYLEELFKIYQESKNNNDLILGILFLGNLINMKGIGCKLLIWNSHQSKEGHSQVFNNQALNTIYNYCSRTLECIKGNELNSYSINSNKIVKLKDARSVDDICNIWITDPPYADAVNYHELSEFFTCWYETVINKVFPNWYTDSKAVLAVKGSGHDFNSSMIDIYSNLNLNMTDDGLQIVMFTHQDVKVWAELAMILWSARFQVTAAWNIATETESGGLKNGNYVKGTVLLVLRKQMSNETAYLDELYPEIEEKVKEQIDSMRELDDKEQPNFSDPDYLLAAYAASLKVLTSYKAIEDIDVEFELSQGRNDKEETPIQKIINEAKKIAYDYLIPVDFDNYLWKELKPVERFYLKGLEFEMNNMCKLSGYQELAKGFGVNEYNWILGSTKANFARVKTPKEFAMRNINDNSVFGQSLLRHVLASIYIALKEDDINKGFNWLKSEVNDYWNNRNMLVEILNYLSKAEVIDSMEHWKECAHEAFILKNLVENDSI